MKSIVCITWLTLIVYGKQKSKFGPLDDQGCFDEFPDCEAHVAKYRCEGRETEVHLEKGGIEITKSVEALVFCRESCKRIYQNATQLPTTIALLGGVDDMIQDVFGFWILVCSLQRGFNSFYRRRLIEGTLISKTRPKTLPAFTKTGFNKVKVPNKIYEILLTHRKQALLNKRIEEEVTLSGAVNCVKFEENYEEQECVENHQGTTFLMEISDTSKSDVCEILNPMADKWAGVHLEPSAVYGIRRYKRGAVLYAHLDRLSTHVISVIINVAQKVNEPWPLYILDHDGGTHRVTLGPGEMLWYESAKLTHGRPLPFNGSYYDNIFVHFKPVSEKWFKDGDTINGVPTRSVTINELKDA